jgi:vancomycin resistance protein YoaR
VTSTLPDELAEEHQSDRRTVRFLVLALAAIPIALYLGALALTWGKVPRGTQVAGVSIGGKAPADAKAALRERLAARAAAPLPVQAADFTAQIVPADSGLQVDIDGTVDGLTRSTYNPVTLFRSFVGRTDVEPDLDADDAALRAAVEKVAVAVDRPAAEGAIRFVGTRPEAVQPQTGRVLDQPGAVSILREQFPAQLDEAPAPMELPVAVTPVKSTPDGVAEALETIAEPAVSGPLKLSGHGQKATLPVATIVKLLRIEAGADGALAATVPDEAVTQHVLPLLKDFEVEPKDAGFRIVDGKVRITPSVNGGKVDAKRLAQQLVIALPRAEPRTMSVPFHDAQPKLTTAKAKALRIKEKVGSFTTHHGCCANRVHNIHTMADIVDGAVVLPGETFSLNGYVGQRDTARGFVRAPMILDGRLQPSVGGGVSQFATTMFNAVFFSGLKDVEHKPHSFYISRYPAGREATVSWPAPDLKWTNDSPYGVLVKTSYTGTSITVTFWSTKRYDEVRSISGPRTGYRPIKKVYLKPGPDCIEAGGAVGFNITVWRAFYKGGKEVRPRESFFTRYVAEPNFICGEDPAKKKPKPSPSPSPTPPPS